MVETLRPRTLAVVCGVALAWLCLPPSPIADAQSNIDDSELDPSDSDTDDAIVQRMDDGGNENFDEEQSAGDGDDADLAVQQAERQRRSDEADANFDAVMQPQNAPASAKQNFAAQALRMNDLPSNVPESPRPASPLGSPGASSEVEVGLTEFTRVRDKLQALHEEHAKKLGPAVVLGAAEYSGRAREGALELKLTLQVTLGHPERWKVVPLVGDDVVLVRATALGQDLPVSRQNGYHVWVTRHTGEIQIVIDMLVPARGPRGSIEYDFIVSRTPVTRFSCIFPVPALEPRLDASVRSEVRTVGGTTELGATLAPTTHIHLVGFRDLGEVDGRAAKVYAESTSLLSVGEHAAELFAVVRYTILYGGAKRFDIAIPKGATVVSADGKGAFHFELEETADGSVLRGETAFPIRDNFEISLRLRRDLDKQASTFTVPLPRSLGVEREHGWLGVEVTGKLKLEEQAAQSVLAIDVRQLPAEMTASAVSPILKAYRFHDAKAEVRLATTRLPEREPTSASVDRLRAFSVISNDGKVLTDLRVTLRNRLRHSLTLTLAPGSEVRSTLLDGEPVKPSRNPQGGLILPLKRSSGGADLQPFTVQVVLAGEVGAMSLGGRKSLELPSVDLPVSSLAWSIFVPANSHYSAPKGDIEPQELVGTATWHQPSHHARGADLQPRSDRLALAGMDGAMGGGSGAGGDERASAGADTGAMPVRIKLPEEGLRLEYERYWIDSDHAVTVSLWYLRSWVRLPIILILMVLAAAGLVLFAQSWPLVGVRDRRPWLGAALFFVVLWPIGFFGGTSSAVLAVLLAVASALARRKVFARLTERVSNWTSEVAAQFRSREKVPRTKLEILWKLTLAAGFLLTSVALLTTSLHLLKLLFSPLPG